uniref:C2H2-type domain-containing protein n=2 Tax=Lotharella globosa TaxID=91324 RepID=A0A7S4DHA6_9EUKA|mmetsp:Transcript_21073/g.42410  ORF Transcript_21073/g.42410 Transcript_21073/m.42410 type:complete len:244 (-) Transcript_21073:215-946(-)
MGRKRKNKNKEKPRKPFCYYCDREFIDEKVLVRHQKAKHFTCQHCYKKLGTVKGLLIHVAQLHKEVLTSIPGCKEGRENLELVISGMNGVPQEIINEHYGIEPDKKQKVGTMAQHAMPNTTIPPVPHMPMMGYPPHPMYGRPPMMHYPPYGMMPPPHMMHGYPPQRYPPQMPPPPPNAQPPPLFPVQQHTAAPTPPSQVPPANGKQVPVAIDSKLVFIFKGDDGVSMEEKRAMLSKYKRNKHS